MVIGILYYAKYQRAKATVPKGRKQNKMAPNIENIELQTRSVPKDDVNKPDRVTGRLTPQLVQRKLEDLGVDFTPYDKYKKKK